MKCFFLLCKNEMIYKNIKGVYFKKYFIFLFLILIINFLFFLILFHIFLNVVK